MLQLIHHTAHETRAPLARHTTSDVTTLAPCYLSELLREFLQLGTVGFGGPITLAGYMQRDLVVLWMVKKVPEPFVILVVGLAGLAFFPRIP